MGDYENLIYLAAVIAILFVAVFVIHFLAKSKSVGEHPKRLPLYCGAVFIVGAAAFMLVAQGVKGSAVAGGFEPFGIADVSGAGELLSAPVDGSFPGAGDVDIYGFDLAFYDGKFLSVSYDAASGGEMQPFQVTYTGRLYPGAREKAAPAPGEPVMPLNVLLRALNELDEAGWEDVLGLPENGSVVLRAAGLMPMGEGYVLSNGVLTPASSLPAVQIGSFPTLEYTAGDVSGYITINDAAV